MCKYLLKINNKKGKKKEKEQHVAMAPVFVCLEPFEQYEVKREEERYCETPGDKFSRCNVSSTQMEPVCGDMKCLC